MNYVSLLSQDEKVTLCKIITGKNFKELFQRNEKEFSKIRKGFVAKSLTEQLALSIAIANVDKPFITMHINETVDIWLKQIQENMEKLEGEGLTHETALATVILDSFFDDNVDMYLKLSGNTLDANARLSLFQMMESICTQIIDDTAKQGIDTLEEECSQKILKIKQENDALKSLLAQAQEKIAELQAESSAPKNDDADYLATFDDTNASVLSAIPENSLASLCGVRSDYNGQKWLIRYADLGYDGCYYIFKKNDGAPPHFANRDRIFYKDGPSDDGFYGIWVWSSIPSKNDPSKDYVSSWYNTDLEATEVTIIKEASSLDELVNLLKGGIEYQPRSHRVMFSLFVSRGQYMGILCNIKELTTANGKTTLSEGCVVVPIYEFTSDDIIRLDSGLSFYRNAFAGLPRSLYHLKSPLEIVKDIVLSSISWTAYKARGATRAEYRTFRDFLGAIPVGNVTGQIRVACRCSDSAAKKLLDEFLTVAWKYMNGDSLEDAILLSAISANTELQQKTKALIYEDWSAQNNSLLTKSREQLDALNDKLKSVTDMLTSTTEALNETKSEEEHLTAILAEKEKLANDVERAVAERIQRARENAADFIANMAFVSGQQMRLAVTETPVAAEAPSEPVIATYRTYSALEDLNDLDAHHSWDNVIDTVAFEFEEAGVAKQYRSGLAAFLCAAYIEKQPVLLVGPNACDIVQAFSAAVAAHKHGMLCCEGSYSDQIISEIGSSGEDIVIINNLLASGWMNRLPEILSQKDIFYVATHPYAEDIQVEPKSLYGFMLPLFTEFFVDKKATGKYYGGYFSDDFRPYLPSKDARKSLKILSNFSLSSLVKNRINSLVTTMHGIYSSATGDDEFLFAVLPIAYASLAINELTEAIANPQKDLAISSNLKHDLRYVLGEI